MPTRRTWRAPIAITTSRLLHRELTLCEADAGCDFEYATTIPDGRRHASRRPIVIIGFDLVARVRIPLRSGGLVIVAGLDSRDAKLFEHAHRIGASYVIALPAARRWLAEQLLHPPTR